MQLTLSSGIDETESRAIAEYLDGLTSGTVQQWPYWAFLNPPSRRQSYLHFKAEVDESELLSAGLVRRSHVVGGYNFASIKRGPATRRIADLNELLPALETRLREDGAISLTVNPYWLGKETEEAVRVLGTHGYSAVDRRLQSMPTATASIRLDGTEEEILARFSSSCRTKIRSSTKKGIEIRPVQGPREAKMLTECLMEMAASTKMNTDNQHDFVRHHEFLSRHPERGCVLAATLGGELFGGAVCYREGARAIMYILATRRSITTNVPRSNLIVFETMLRMKALGCTVYDMIGYPDDRYENKDTAVARAKFKASFRPEIDYVTPIMTKPLRPMHYNLANWARTAYRSSKSYERLKALVHGTGQGGLEASEDHSSPT